MEMDWSERGMEIECEGDGFTGSTQGQCERDRDIHAYYGNKQRHLALESERDGDMPA